MNVREVNMKRASSGTIVAKWIYCFIVINWYFRENFDDSLISLPVSISTLNLISFALQAETLTTELQIKLLQKNVCEELRFKNWIEDKLN